MLIWLKNQNKIRYRTFQLRFKPSTPFRQWLFRLCCWIVCYAWWYPVQEVAYLVQGYGLGDSQGAAWGKVGLTIAHNLLFTWLFARGFHRFVQQVGEEVTPEGGVVELSFLSSSELSAPRLTTRYLERAATRTASTESEALA